MSKIGIIGGSGLEKLNLFTDAHETFISTMYGKPSSGLLEGKLEGKDVVILSRHGRDHTFPPTQVNNRANIQALKQAGCTHILATTACGSLREDIHRGDLVIMDQFIDFTRHRTISFFESFKPGEMKHTPMADPFDDTLRHLLIESARELHFSYQPFGTVVTIEGPRFSTRAESRMFKMLGGDIINMSTAPEATLANEIGIPYAAVGLVTDYDCWKLDEPVVTWEEVLKQFSLNVERVTQVLLQTIKKIA